MSARIRARLRALSDDRRPPSRLQNLFAAAGVPFANALPSAAMILVVGSAAGAVVLGASGAVVGGPCALGGALVLLRKRSSARFERLETAFPLAVRAMSDTVRAGGNVQQAIAQAAEEAAPPMSEELHHAVGELEIGVPIEDVLASLAARCRVPGADVLAIALTSAVRSGADVRPVLECIVEAATDRRRLRRELRAATAQGRMTALVIGLLPAAFLLIMGAGGGRELRFLFREPAGWALIAAGLVLEAAGFAWMRRLGRAS